MMVDAKGSTKKADPDEIMAPAEMKQILATAKRGRPISCVIALTKDKEAIILLDRKIKPKKLVTDVKKQSASAGLELEMTTLRFGHASVDTERDSALVTFTVNKEAPNAMRPHLLERLKKAGFTKVELTVQGALEDEPEIDEEEEEEEVVKPPATADDIMAPAMLKQLLAIAKRGNPLSCAVALTTTKEGILLLDREMKPKKVAAAMKKQAAALELELDMTSVRFGRALVDTDVDSGLVVVKVNKAASNALHLPLLARLKKAGFTGLDLSVESALEDEDEDEAAGSAEAQPPVSAGESAPDAAATKPDMHAIVAAAAELIKKLPPLLAHAPEEKSHLTDLAKEVNAKIHAGDAQAAAAAAKLLQTAIAAAEDASRAKNDGADGPTTDSADWDKKRPVFGKAAKIWEATVSKTEEDLHKIRQEILDTFEGDDEGLKLEKAFLDELNSCLNTLDMSLHKELTSLAKKDTGPSDDEPTATARKLIDGHIKYLQSDQFMTTVDDNPFDIKIVKRLNESLSKIRAVLQ